MSSYAQYQFLHKREETFHNTFAFGSDLPWQFLFWPLIPSFNLRIFFKAITDQTSLMLALFFKEKVKSFWQTQFYFLVYLCICSPLMFFTASLIFLLLLLLVKTSRCCLLYAGGFIKAHAALIIFTFSESGTRQVLKFRTKGWSSGLHSKGNSPVCIKSFSFSRMCKCWEHEFYYWNVDLDCIPEMPKTALDFAVQTPKTTSHILYAH